MRYLQRGHLGLGLGRAAPAVDHGRAAREGLGDEVVAHVLERVHAHREVVVRGALALLGGDVIRPFASKKPMMVGSNGDAVYHVVPPVIAGSESPPSVMLKAAKALAGYKEPPGPEGGEEGTPINPLKLLPMLDPSLMDNDRQIHPWYKLIPFLSINKKDEIKNKI